MFSYLKLLLFFVLQLCFFISTAQQVKEPKIDEKWIKEIEPFRLAGNLYFVGTEDLGCYLITTPKGHVRPFILGHR